MAIKAIVFDWGDTIMRDFPFEGAMKNWPFVSVLPGVKEVLAELKQNYMLVLGSNAGDSSSLDIVEALRRENIDHYFYQVYSSKDLGYEKPHIQFFKAIERELRLEESEMMMIGNNCKKDLQGAKQAGWTSIWFNENESMKEACKYADATVYHMSALLEVIENI